MAMCFSAVITARRDAMPDAVYCCCADRVRHTHVMWRNGKHHHCDIVFNIYTLVFSYQTSRRNSDRLTFLYDVKIRYSCSNSSKNCDFYTHTALRLSTDVKYVHSYYQRTSIICDLLNIADDMESNVEVISVTANLRYQMQYQKIHYLSPMTQTSTQRSQVLYFLT